MKDFISAILLVIIVVVVTGYMSAASDPNYVEPPMEWVGPAPGVQYLVADPNCLTITTSVKVTKKDLLKKKAYLERRIKRSQDELYHVNAKLAVFKE